MLVENKDKIQREKSNYRSYWIDLLIILTRHTAQRTNDNTAAVWGTHPISDAVCIPIYIPPNPYFPKFTWCILNHRYSAAPQMKP